MSILDDHLLYNGEIYNFDELNKMLKNPVESRSDTELLLKLLMEYGETIIEKIMGIFAFVYVHNDEVIIARDHVGVKPLYYTILDNDILVSSEIKALLLYGIKPQMGLDEIAEQAIPIEQRAAAEVTGVAGSFGAVQWAPTGAAVYNPAFDVTPAGLISGWVLDSGVVTPAQVAAGAFAPDNG